MASSFYSNTVHVDFESVLAMDDPGMVSMFQALIASGLQGFLGCSAVIHEEALLQFFANGTVRDGLVVSTVHGVTVVISEQLFAETFELTVEVLADLTDVPKDKIFDAKSIVSLTVKAGSFNAITVKKFAMVTAVVCAVKVNWISVLFTILKKMVTEGTRQAKGFAIQISLLLENVPNLELGESSEFPSSKILTERTIHRYIVLKDKSGAQEAADAPPVKKASRKPAASKKRPADVTVEAPVEAVPIQMVEPTVATPAAEVTGEADGEEAVAAEVDSSADRDQPAGTTNERQWFDLSHEELIAKWDAERQVTTPDDTDEEIEAERPVFGTVAGNAPLQSVDITAVTEPVVEQHFESVAVVEPAVELGEAAADKDFSLVDDPDTVINQVLNKLDSIYDDKDDKQSDRAETWFDRAFYEMLRNDSPVVTPSDTDEDVEMREDKQVDGLIDANEAMSLEDIMLSIPLDISLPSAGIEITKITMGKEIQIPDIDLLVKLRAQVIDDVTPFFNSFSLKKLATLNVKEMSKKEEKVLSCGETESAQVAIQRKLYILLKYRELLVKKYLDSWRSNFVPELTKEAQAHGLTWKKTCCSQIFEGSPRDRGAVIARTNTNTRSSCWIRTMMRVNGTWVIEPCADQWVKIPQPIISSEVPRQLSYVDTLPPVSDFFKTFKKRLADVHMELAQSFITGKLLPVGARNFCRDIVVVEPASRPLRPTITSRIWFQLCTVFTQFCLFHRINSVDVSDFVSSIASERTALRSVQIEGSPILVSPNSVSVAPVLQLLDEPSSSESSSDDISMNFADQDTAATTSAPSPDISEALNQLRVSIDEIREQDDAAKHKDTILLHLHDFEKQVIARLDAHDRIVTTGLDVVDVRRVVRESHQELNARINSLDEQVAATRNDLLECSAQAQQTLNIITSQLSELVAYINRGGDNKKGEVRSSSRPPPPPADQIRDTSNAGGRTPDFEQGVEMGNQQAQAFERERVSLRIVKRQRLVKMKRRRLGLTVKFSRWCLRIFTRWYFSRYTFSQKNQQIATVVQLTNRWYLTLAIVKRCRLDKWIRQRFAFVL
ncbi:pentatricopeptide repeat-containing protein mitochondrial-like [Dorcoceras hygrometricum]|uniref:Pentatricopeptide repeat-containing protein mitochondrial-like n=1 Tax=Dorcoceras hygrometricum TaxID=472368 RepID=A0A2Z7CI50_9LAMI|nr:pentatricopeptide repeat-containing protein mitochondrial-like [Dorcoceras hygrometricum]